MPVSNRPITVAGHDLLGVGGQPQGDAPHGHADGALLGRIPVAYGPTMRRHETVTLDPSEIAALRTLWTRDLALMEARLVLALRPWYVRLWEMIRGR